MATQITQNEIDGRTELKIEGDMMFDDALLLERLALGIVSDDDRPVLIDLADLDFIDSEAAPVIRRLASSEMITIEGIEIFLQSVIDEVEGR